MPGPKYTSVPEADAPFDLPRLSSVSGSAGEPPLGHEEERRRLDEDGDGSSDSDSDIVYRDNLDVEPFSDEKQARVDNRFQDEPTMEYGEEGFSAESRRLRPRKKSRRVLAALLAIVLSSAMVGVLAGWGYSAPSYSAKSGNKHITLDHIINGTFAAKTTTINWVKEASDGTFSTIDSDHNILLSSVHNTSDTTILVDSSLVLDGQGSQLHWSSWSLSADMQYVLFQVDYVKQWRHSSHANYYLHRLSDHVTFPLNPPQHPPVISKVVWAPLGHALSYVMNNNLYVVPEDQLAGSDPMAIQVTDDGSSVIFNGVPDWVYEEEVYTSDFTLWWSPDADTVAYLRMDEDKVREYKLEYWNPTNDAFSSNQYPTELDMKYPKPGTPNPYVSVHTFSLQSYAQSHIIDEAKRSLSWPEQLDQDDQVITEVSWVGQKSLLVKEVDRASKRGNVILFTDGANEGKIVRKLGKDGEQGDDGWVDQRLEVRAVPGWTTDGYLDIIPNQGYDHIALFSPLDASEPIWLTSGEWEVERVVGLNTTTGQVYFVAANPSIDRHLYSVPLPTSSNFADYTQDMVALTDTSNPGVYDVSMSPGAGYYLLSYKGPEVPYQRLKEVDHGGLDVMINDNQALNTTLSEFMRPVIVHSTISNDGYDLNMMEIRPTGLDTSGRKRYPVLLSVYGGPGSQQVNNVFKRDWVHYLACEKKYIIVVIDPRGTGFKGRNHRNPVRDNLGHYEVLDFIKTAGELSQRSYVDSKRIGIWGWSYGGYITLKTLEAASGAFSLGVAVAPVTDWMLYDSIYTERYMSTPSSNAAGYISSSVNNVTAFGSVDLAWAHGSGDDNVHYGHTAELLDKLTQEHVRGWRFRMFTDSDHSMNKREAYKELYIWMTSYIEEKWGRGGTIRHG